MKLRLLYALLLFAFHAQAADEHAGSTAPAVAANAEAAQPQVHVHGAESASPITADSGEEAAAHVPGTDAGPPASAHVHEATVPDAAANAAEHVHATADSPTERSSAPVYVDNSASMQEARHMAMMMHGATLNTYLIAERFEHVRDGGDDALQWEMQGWVGGDLNKLWFKTEGGYDTDSNHSEEIEVQALYSRAVAPYWDFQAGVRQDNGFGPSRTYAVFGFQGLAPYWFEVDAAAFLSERGDLSARIEAEYDLRFTQRLLLQPRLELNHAFSEDAAIGAGKGLRDASFGLRLRYEIRREFAPYIGVEWHKAYGDTATFSAQRGADTDSLNVVAGVRIWY